MNYARLRKLQTFAHKRFEIAYAKAKADMAVLIAEEEATGIYVDEATSQATVAEVYRFTNVFAEDCRVAVTH